MYLYLQGDFKPARRAISSTWATSLKRPREIGFPQATWFPWFNRFKKWQYSQIHFYTETIKNPQIHVPCVSRASQTPHTQEFPFEGPISPGSISHLSVSWCKWWSGTMKRDKDGKPRLQMQHEWRIKWPSATKWYCKQKLYHPVEGVYKKNMLKKNTDFVVKLIEISTSKFLHCRLNRRSVNVWQQVIPPSDNLCLCHRKGSVHGVVHRDCLTNKQGCTWKHLETLKIRVFLFLFQHWA